MTDRLRDRLGRRGRGRARRRDRGDRHRPPPARRGAARLPDPAPGDLAAIRSPSSARPGSPTSSRSRCAAPRRAERELDLVALATVADLVPLRGENRALVRRGLAVARRARRPGMRALMAVAVDGPGAPRRGRLRLPPRAADQRRRAPLPRRRRGRADADRRRGPRRRDRRRARARQPRAARGRARGARRPPRRARRELPDELGRRAPGWCSPARAGTRAWSGSSPRGWSSAIAARWSLIALDARRRGPRLGPQHPGLRPARRRCGPASAHLSRYGGHRAAAGLEIEAGRGRRLPRAPSPPTARTALADAPAGAAEVVDAVVGGESLGHDVAEQLDAAGAVRQRQPRRPAARPGGQARRRAADGGGGPPRALHADQRRRAGRSGVAFGVNGSLAAAAAASRVDVSVELELNEWNGAVEPRVVLGEVYPVERRARPRTRCELSRRGVLAPPRARARRASSARGRRRRAARPARARRSTAAAARRSRRSPRSPRAARRCWRCAPTRSAAASWSSARRARPGSAAASSRSSPRASPTPPSPPPRRRVIAAGCGVVLADWAALAPRPGPRRALPPRGRHRPAAVRAPRPPGRARRGLPAPPRRAAPRPSSRCACTPTSGRRGARSPSSTGRSARAAGGLDPAAARAVLCGERPRPPALARGRRARRPGCSPSSSSCAGTVQAQIGRSGSYPRRGRISSDPRRSSPTATATRRVGDT